MSDVRFLYAATALIAAVLAACAEAPPHADAPPAPAAVAAASNPAVRALELRGHGGDALGMIGNLVAHDGRPVPLGRASGIVRLLDDPFAVDARAIGLPAGDSPVPPLDWAPPDDLPEAVRAFVAQLASALADARARLAHAVPAGCCDRDALRASVESPESSAPALEVLVRAVDARALDGVARATMGLHDRVLAAFADLRYDEAGRLAGGALATEIALLPASRRFASPVGDVVLAGIGDDWHDAPAAIVIDADGNDTYDLAALAADGVVVVDLAGNDRYESDAAAVLGLTVAIDFAGDDVRNATSGQAAAIGGAALLRDLTGDDVYGAAGFAQGAAVAGFAALIDDHGNDRYRVGWRGQGFGGPLGFAALIDHGGDDDYRAEGGPADPFARSGGTLSYAQGVGAGWRGALAGGVGLLRDTAGNDRYQAEMFAQGAGTFFGLGLLDDRAGDDAYIGTRYGQGIGAHGGVGALADGAGRDGYALSVGVGQGMGLDLGVGVLADDAGADRYHAGTLAQGASTGNGFGLLADRGGDDAYELGDGDGWGRARAARGLPGLPFLVDAAGSDTYLLGGEALAARAPAEWGGPLAGRDAELPSPARHQCPAAGADPYAYAPGDPLAEWVGQAAPMFGEASGLGLAYYARLWASLPASVPALLAEVPPGEASLTANLGTLLRCYLRVAEPESREAARRHLIDALLRGAPQAGLAVELLRESPPDPETALAAAEAAFADPVCSTRAGALSLARTGAGDPVLAEPLAALALRGLGDPCWHVKAWALDLWRQVAAGPPPAEVVEELPGVLKGRLARPVALLAE